MTDGGRGSKPARVRSTGYVGVVVCGGRAGVCRARILHGRTSIWRGTAALGARASSWQGCRLAHRRPREASAEDLGVHTTTQRTGHGVSRWETHHVACRRHHVARCHHVVRAAWLTPRPARVSAGRLYPTPAPPRWPVPCAWRTRCRPPTSPPTGCWTAPAPTPTRRCPPWWCPPTRRPSRPNRPSPTAAAICLAPRPRPPALSRTTITSRSSWPPATPA